LAVSLAQASQLVAQTSTDATEATTYLNDADSYYEQATRLAPNNADYWNGWARLNLIVRGDKAAALQKIQTSLTVDSAYGVTYALFGDYWAVLGNAESDETIQQSDYQRAADNYYQALKLQPNGTTLTARSSLGQVETALKHYDAALTIYNDLLQRAPDAPDVWLVYNALARIYLAQGNKVKALENAYLSLNFAPNQTSKDKAQAFINAVSTTTP
jgi:tetratricopeptide (TPR) repeat protein